MDEETRITEARMDALLAFREALERPGRTFVHAVEPGDGSAPPSPYPRYHDDVLAFMQEAGRPWWSDYGYVPIEAWRMIRDPARVEAASLDEVRTMLTWCVRGERFGDGHWNAALEEGRVQSLLRRLAVLRADRRSSQSR